MALNRDTAGISFMSFGCINRPPKLLLGPTNSSSLSSKYASSASVPFSKMSLSVTMGMISSVSLSRMTRDTLNTWYASLPRMIAIITFPAGDPARESAPKCFAHSVFSGSVNSR